MMSRLVHRLALLFLLVLPATVQADEDRRLPTHYGHAAFSPTNDTLAVAIDRHQIGLFDTERGRQTRIIHRNVDRNISFLAWNPDASAIAVGSEIVTVHDAQTGAELWRAPNYEQSLRRIFWTPSGDALVGVTTRSVILWTPGSSDPPRILETDEDYVWSAALGPQGQTVATIDEHGLVRLWNIETGEITEVPAGYGWCECYIAWHPEQNLLAFSGHSRTSNPKFNFEVEHGIRLWSLEQNAARIDLSADAKGSILIFSPDGKTLAVAHGWWSRWTSSAEPASISLWDTETSHRTHVLTIEDQNVTFLAWTADSRRLAAGGSARTYVRDETGEIQLRRLEPDVSLWDAGSGELIRKFPVRADAGE